MYAISLRFKTMQTHHSFSALFIISHANRTKRHTTHLLTYTYTQQNYLSVKWCAIFQFQFHLAHNMLNKKKTKNPFLTLNPNDICAILFLCPCDWLTDFVSMCLHCRTFCRSSAYHLSNSQWKPGTRSQNRANNIYTHRCKIKVHLCGAQPAARMFTPDSAESMNVQFNSMFVL